MKLYSHPASIASRPVRLLIAEKGLDIEEEIVDLFTGAHHQEPYVSINPNRLVPMLEDGDLKLTESSAILKYLADTFDMAEYPKDLKARAKVNEVMDWFNSNFYREWGYNLCYPQLFPHHKRVNDEVHAATIEWGREKSTFWLNVLNDHWLGDGRTYLTGNNVTIADYFGASYLGAGDLIRQDFSKFPNIKRWYDTMKSLKNWGPTSEALDSFAASLSEQEFVTA